MAGFPILRLVARQPSLREKCVFPVKRLLYRSLGRQIIEVKQSPLHGKGIFLKGKTLETGVQFDLQTHLKGANDGGMKFESRLFADNDCTQLKDDIEVVKELERFYDSYYLRAKENCNFRFILYPNNTMIAETLRQVVPGEELLRCYGFSEWFRWWFVHSITSSDKNEPKLKQFILQYASNEEVYRNLHHFLTQKTQPNK